MPARPRLLWRAAGLLRTQAEEIFGRNETGRFLLILKARAAGASLPEAWAAGFPDKPDALAQARRAFGVEDGPDPR